MYVRYSCIGRVVSKCQERSIVLTIATTNTHCGTFALHGSLIVVGLNHVHQHTVNIYIFHTDPTLPVTSIEGKLNFTVSLMLSNLHCILLIKELTNFCM